MNEQDEATIKCQMCGGFGFLRERDPTDQDSGNEPCPECEERRDDTPRTDACLSKYVHWMMKEERSDRAHGWNSLAEHARQLERELAACNADWNKRYQQWGYIEDRLRAEIKSLHRYKAGVDEALNTGDGTYKP